MITRFGLPEEAIEKINGVLNAHTEVESAILYGSRAKGNFKPGSDIDLALVGENLTHDLLLKITTELDDLLLPWMVDVLLFSQIDLQPLREHIERVGRTFYERSGRGGAS